MRIKKYVIALYFVAVNAIASTSNAGLPWETTGEKISRIIETWVPVPFLIIAVIFLILAFYLESSVVKMRCAISGVILFIVAMAIKIFL